MAFAFYRSPPLGLDTRSKSVLRFDCAVEFVEWTRGGSLEVLFPGQPSSC
jgi:hypothetical protein